MRPCWRRAPAPAPQPTPGNAAACVVTGFEPGSKPPIQAALDLSAVADRTNTPLAPLCRRRTFLYTLVAADYDGAALLPHFIRHYAALGIAYSNMLIHIQHNSKLYPGNNVDGVIDICRQFGTKYWCGGGLAGIML